MIVVVQRAGFVLEWWCGGCLGDDVPECGHGSTEDVCDQPCVDDGGCYGGETGTIRSSVFGTVINDERHVRRGCSVADKRMATGTERVLDEDWEGRVSLASVTLVNDGLG